MTKKKSTALTNISPDSIEHVEQNDLLQITLSLLERLIDATDIMSTKEMTPHKLREVKTILGYINASNSVMKTKMSLFKMVGIDEKAEVLKKRSRDL